MDAKRPDHDRYLLARHDPNWLKLAAEEIENLRPIFGPCLVQAHHVGSTSIPGIMAKPILDLVAEVTDMTELDARRPEFEAIGYVWRGEFGIPGRRYIRPDDNRVHWHCYAAGTERVHEHLAFRDFLRTYPSKAQVYEAAKVDAMAKHEAGGSNYLDEKSPTVEALLVEALAWTAKRGARGEKWRKVGVRHQGANSAK